MRNSMIGETIPTGRQAIDLTTRMMFNRFLTDTTDYLDLLGTRLNPLGVVVLEDIIGFHNENFRYWLRALRFRFGALRGLTTLGRFLRIIPTQAWCARRSFSL